MMKYPALVFSLLLCPLAAAGCLRVGYEARDRAPDAGDDGGSDGGAGGRRANDGGESGRGGNGETGGHGGTIAEAGDGGDGGGAGRGAGGRAGTPAGGNGGGPASDAGPHDGGDDDDHDDDDDDDSGDHDDGSNDAGPSSGDCSRRTDALFCDGFEDPSFARWSYKVVNNGSVARSTAQKRTGEASLLATTGPAAFGTEARYATSALNYLKSGDLWMRYYYYVPSSVSVTSHFSAGVMSEIQEPYAGFSLIVRPNRTDLSSMAGPIQGSTAFPRDRWVCVELHVKIDPVDGSFEAYLDGAIAVRSPAVNSVPATGYRNAEVGIHYAEAAQGPVEAYVDDVVVATTRVPCD